MACFSPGGCFAVDLADRLGTCFLKCGGSGVGIVCGGGRLAAVVVDFALDVVRVFRFAVSPGKTLGIDLTSLCDTTFEIARPVGTGSAGQIRDLPEQHGADMVGI